MKKVSSFDGTKIAYIKQSGDKDKPTLVFLHGVGGNYTTWKNELKFFKKQKYPCIAIDFRGHGESDAPKNFIKYSIESFSKDVDAVLDAEKITKFCLIGHSLGGGVAASYHLISNRKAEKVILIEPSLIYPFSHDNLLKGGPFLTKLFRKIAYNKKLRDEHFPHFKEIDLSQKGITQKLHIIKHLIQITPIRSIVFTLDQGEIYYKTHFKDIKKLFESFDRPLLVITSDEDEVCPPENAKKIAELNKKHAKFYLIHNAGHLVTITHPEEVSKVIKNFIEGKKLPKN